MDSPSSVNSRIAVATAKIVPCTGRIHSFAISACRTIADTFGTRVLCTLGEKGSLYVSDEGVWECSAPKVPMRGFSGAGDTYLAGFISLLTQGGSVPESLRFGAAMAAAKVSLPGNTVPSVEEAETHYSNVSVRKLF